MPAIIQSIVDTKSYDMWIKAGSNKLHHTKRFGYEPGTIVLCINNHTASILGVAIIKTVCSEHHLLDPETYTEEYAKYNKYECDVTFREFARPISCSDVSKMCGADPAKRSWFLHLSMCTCYLAGEKVPAEVKEAFQKLVMTWV
jgi:hypothetical protein